MIAWGTFLSGVLQFLIVVALAFVVSAAIKAIVEGFKK